MSFKNSKNDFLKLLTRTSILGLAALSASNAMAAATTRQTSANNLATYSAGTNLTAPISYASSDDLQLIHDIPSFSIVTAVTSPTALDLNDKTLGKIIGKNGASIGGVYDGSGNNKTSPLELEANAAFELTATNGGALGAGLNDYSGLGDVTIGNGATLSIAPAVAADLEFNGTVKGAADGQGTLSLAANTGQTTTFKGVIGGDNKKLAAIDIDDTTVTFKADVSAKAINLNHANSVINLETASVTGVIADATGGNGKLNFVPGTASKVTGNVGANGEELAQIDVGAVGKGATHAGFYDGETKTAINLYDAGSTLTISNYKVEADIDNLSGADGNGKIIFYGNSTVASKIGNTKSFAAIEVKAGTAEITSNTLKADAITISNDATLSLATAGVNDLDFDGTVNGAADGQGTLSINNAGKTTTFNGVIGGAQKLAAIKVEAGTLETKSGTLNADAITIGNAATLSIAPAVAADLEFNGAVNGAADGQGTLSLATNTGQTTTFKGVIGGDNKKLAAIDIDDTTVTFKADVAANAINLNHANSVINLEGNSKLGPIATAVAGKGKLNFDSGNSKVSGNVGVGNKLAEINIEDASAEFHGGKTDTNIHINHANSILTISNYNVNAEIDNKTPNDGEGKIIFSGNSTVAGQIGQTKSFESIEVKDGITTLSEHINVQEALTIGENATLKLTKANTSIEAPIDGGGILDIGEDVGTSQDITLKSIHFSVDKTLLIDGKTTNTVTANFTTETSEEGEVEVVDADGVTIIGNIGENNGNSLKQLTVNFAGDAVSSLKLDGNYISAKAIEIVGHNVGAVALDQTLNLGSSDKLKPQIIISEDGIDATANKHLPGINIDGHAYIKSDISNNVEKLVLQSSDTNLYYSGTNQAKNLIFEDDASLYTFSGDNTIASTIKTNDKKGSIIATGTTADEAKAAFLAGDTSFNINAKKYTDSLTLSGEIGGADDSLKLVDVGNGTLELKGANDVNIDKVAAKKLHLEGGKYRINTANIDELHFAGNATLKENSTLLGTKEKHLESDLTFSGAHTLTLQNNVDIHIQENGSDLLSGGGAKLVFEGASNVYSQLGTNTDKFDTITLSKADSYVVFEDDIHLTNDLAFANADAKAVIHGNLYGNVEPNVDDVGHLIVYGENSKINSIGAGGNKLKELNLYSKKVEIGGLRVNNIQFNEDSELTIKDGANSAINNISSDDQGTVIINGGGNIALGNVRLKAIKMGSDTTNLSLQDKATASTHIHAPKGSTATFAFKGASTSPELLLGTEDSRFANITFAGDVTFKDAYSDKYAPGANTITFRKAHGLVDLSAGGTANVIGNGYVTATGDGTINVAGKNVEIAKAGANGASLKALNIVTSGASAHISGDIYANALNHKNTEIMTSSNTLLTGNYVGDNAAFDLGGAFAVKGEFTASNIISVNDRSEGVILDLKETVNTDISSLSKIALNLNAKDGSSIKDNRKIIEFSSEYENDDANPVKLFLDKVSVSTNHIFRDVKLKAEGKDAYITVSDATSETVSNFNIPAVQKTSLIEVIQGNDSLADDIGNAPNASEAAMRYASTSENTEKTLALIENSLDEVANQAVSRLTSLAPTVTSANSPNPSNTKLRTEGNLGVSAGDTAEKFGLWGMVTAGSAEQKTRKLASAYKTSGFGSIVGMDTMLDDKTIVGFAFGNSSSDVKFKGTKLGDKLKSNSWIFTGYGSYAFHDNFFARAGLTASANRISSSEKRIGAATGVANAVAKYTAEALNAEVGIGYNYMASSGGVFTPSAGIRITRVNDIEFKESGAGIQNKHIKHKASARTAALLGAQYTYNTNWDDIEITPEAHVNLQYGIGAKTPKGEFKPLSSSNMVNYVGQKPAKFSSNFGASITSHVDNIEYGAGYDVNMSDKYLGHQGSVKVKIKF